MKALSMAASSAVDSFQGEPRTLDYVLESGVSLNHFWNVGGLKVE